MWLSYPGFSSSQSVTVRVKQISQISRFSSPCAPLHRIGGPVISIVLGVSVWELLIYCTTQEVADRLLAMKRPSSSRGLTAYNHMPGEA